MNKTGLLLLLTVMAMVTLAVAQQPVGATTPDSDGIVHTSANMPFVRFQTPTAADITAPDLLPRNGFRMRIM